MALSPSRISGPTFPNRKLFSAYRETPWNPCVSDVGRHSYVPVGIH